MFINDSNKESCLFENIIEHETMKMYNFDKKHIKSIMTKYLFYEAITFVIGIHPIGRYACYEDAVYSCTENEIICSLPDGKTNKVEPNDFIALFVATNLNGEGTPIFVCNNPFKKV